MKINVTYVLIAIAGILIAANSILFAKTIVLGDTLLKMERETQQLKIANLDLTKELYSQTSLEALSKDAEVMGFVKVAQPITLESLATYALLK